MELSHLLKLVSELPNNTTLNYVRGTDSCKFIDVDIPGQRINSETPTHEPKSWAPTYLSELAPKIKENVPFNLSGLLNNKGSFRPVLETIIAHTREFYTVRKGTATALVWIPTKPKTSLELEEIDSSEIPPANPDDEMAPIVDREKLAVELKKGFITYFTNYLRLSTGKCDEKKIEQYLNLYTRFVETPLKERFPEFNSIFDFDDISELNNFLFKAKEVLPNLSVLLFDKWPQNKEEQTLYYEPWTMVRHYKVFLELLKSFNKIAISVKPNRASLDKTEIDKVKENTSNYLRAMRTKPFLLLAGISGTGKSRIVKQMAFDSCPDNAVLRSDLTSPGNYCLIEVKPNWHDSTELLGYESQIGKPHYQLTPFVKFLAKAMLYPDVPFFVCLDEMNLAPVEQYFAEFLSVLESRTKIDRHIVSEPLIKAEIFRKYNMEKSLFSLEEETTAYNDANKTVEPAPTYGKEVEVYNSLKEHGLRIPENVIVIGTVNMDETTHQFSRKVIDRAMTIEMNLPEGDPFMDFFTNGSELAYRANPTSPSLYLATETRASDVVKALAADNAEKTDWLKGEVAAFLISLNSALDGTPFKVAYRVQNELMLYFYQLWLEDKTARWRDILNTACDQILMMKVLPRVEGDEELLEKPLEKLAAFCEPYPIALKKIKEMTDRLGLSRFASFWP
jgi:hypothetical protein